MSKIIDAKGKNCPMPVIMAKKEIENGIKNFIIEVDNKIAVENLKRLANSYELNITVDGKDSIFKVTFSSSCIECEEVLAKLEGKKPLGDYTIFIGKDTIGSGDDNLGSSLMKMFLYTLSEDDDIPQSILFMNSGVKVPTVNEQCIESLKKIEEFGVEILVCGACLNFYHLEDKLPVGRVSNMYEISDRMKKAAKVITL